MIPRFVETSLSGVFLIDPHVFEDERGFFMETFHQRKYAEAGLDRVFVQDNHSHSRQGTLRGLHYQLQNPQAKLVYVVNGEIMDVAVDIRRGSPTFGQWEGTVLSAKNKRQIFVPEGYAHGFCVQSKTADVIYKCTELYDAGDEYGIYWADTTIGIDWPIDNPRLSNKDSQNPRLSEISDARLPVYKAT